MTKRKLSDVGSVLVWEGFFPPSELYLINNAVKISQKPLNLTCYLFVRYLQLVCKYLTINVLILLMVLTSKLTLLKYERLGPLINPKYL